MKCRTKEGFDEGEATFYKTSCFDLVSSKGVSLTEVAHKVSCHKECMVVLWLWFVVVELVGGKWFLISLPLKLKPGLFVLFVYWLGVWHKTPTYFICVNIVFFHLFLALGMTCLYLQGTWECHEKRRSYNFIVCGNIFSDFKWVNGDKFFVYNII